MMKKRCIFCGTFTYEEDSICGTCRWKIEIENEEDRKFQKNVKKRIREKLINKKGGVR